MFVQSDNNRAKAKEREARVHGNTRQRTACRRKENGAIQGTRENTAPPSVSKHGSATVQPGITSRSYCAAVRRARRLAPPKRQETMFCSPSSERPSGCDYGATVITVVSLSLPSTHSRAWHLNTLNEWRDNESGAANAYQRRKM
ncbi:hypothetical protein MRX96_013519 [Rhipicephalus microplus]